MSASLKVAPYEVFQPKNCRAFLACCMIFPSHPDNTSWYVQNVKLLVLWFSPSAQLCHFVRTLVILLCLTEFAKGAIICHKTAKSVPFCIPPENNSKKVLYIYLCFAAYWNIFTSSNITAGFLTALRMVQ